MKKIEILEVITKYDVKFGKDGIDYLNSIFETSKKNENIEIVLNLYHVTSEKLGRNPKAFFTYDELPKAFPNYDFNNEEIENCYIKLPIINIERSIYEYFKKLINNHKYADVKEFLKEIMKELIKCMKKK